MNRAGFGKQLLATVTLLLLVGAGLSQPVPSANPHGYEWDAFINSQTKTTVSFSNTGDAVGYGPFLDVFMPVLDGLDLTGATYISSPVIVHEVVVGGDGAYVHPLTGENHTGGTPGETLYVLELPFGSVTPEQPAIDIELDLQILPTAALEVPIEFGIMAGFRYGDSPTGSTPIFNAADAITRSVTPRLAILRKRSNAPEDETAVGPSFEREYTVSLEIAPGQTITDLVITDTLPNNIVITSMPTAAGSDWGFALNEPAEPGNCAPADGISYGPKNDWTLTATRADATEGDTDLDFSFTFYVPFEDANCQAVALGEDSVDKVINTVGGSGNWRQEGATVAVPVTLAPDTNIVDITRNQGGGNGEGNEASGIMMIQKYVRRADPPAPTPPSVESNEVWVGAGTELTYTLNFQISDHSAFKDVIIVDRLDDGLEFLPDTATLSFTQHGNPVHSGNLDAAAVNVTGGGNEAEETITFSLNHGEALGTGFNLLGACVAANGGVAAPCYGSTTGTLTYQAVVLDKYRADNSKAIVQGDVLHNNVGISGEVLRRSNLTSTEIRDGDDSKATVRVPMTTAVKSIAAINGSPFEEESSDQISAGDTVTFRLRAELPTSDIRDFVMTDYLPLPVFQASELAGFEFTNTTDDAYPDAGEAWFTTASTFLGLFPSALPDPVATLSVQAATNSVTFDFGSHDFTGSTASVIEILLTVTVGDTATADDLYLTNLLRTTENGNVVSQGIQQIKHTRPVLNITNGVVAVDPDSRSAVASPNAWPFDGLITDIRADRLNALYTSPLHDLDAGDKVTYAIIVENTGYGRNGAFNLIVNNTNDAAYDAGIVDVSSVRGYLGTGAAVFNSTTTGIDLADLFTSGLSLAQFDELDDPKLGLLKRGHDEEGEPVTDGSNILIILYEVTLPYPTETLSTFGTRSEVTQYTATPTLPTATPAGLDLVIPVGSVWHDTEISTRGISVTKSVIASSEADTTDPNITIGEVVRYRLVMNMPEGTSTNLDIVDTLPPGLSYLPGTARAGFVAAAAGSLTTTTSPVIPVSATVPTDEPLGTTDSVALSSVTVTGNTVTFSFGTVTNTSDSAADEQLIVEFNAVLLNKAGSNDADPINASGDTLSNSAFARTQPVDSPVREHPAGSVGITVVQPALTVKKTVDADDTDNIVEAGDTVTYTITVTNTGSASAYEISISDEISKYLSNVVLTPPSGATNPLVSPGTGDDPSVVSFDFPSLAVDASFEFEISGKLIATVPTGLEIGNTAVATFSSLPGDKGTEQNTTGSATPGDPGDWNGERNYKTTGSVDFTTKAVQPTKTIASTSEVHTEENETTGVHDVAIGEIIRYRLHLNIPEGNTAGLTFTDTLEDGLEFIDVIGSSPQVELFAEGAGLSFVDSGLDDAKSGSMALPDTRIDLSTDGRTITFTLGDLVNPPQEPVAAAWVAIEFNVLVQNSDSNSAGPGPANNFIARANDVNTTSTSVGVNIVEPDLSITKQVTAPVDGRITAGNISGADVGETITFTATISNATGGTVSNAFDINVKDKLPSGLKLLTAEIDPEDAGYDVTVDSTDNSFTVTSDPGTAVAPGTSVTVTYTAEVTSAVHGDPLENTASFTATSLPGPRGTLGGSDSPNETGSDTPGATGELNGERHYAKDGSATTTVAIPRLGITKSPETVTPVNNANGSYTLSYDIKIENTGDVRVQGIQVTDDLAATFANATTTPAATDVISITSAGLSSADISPPGQLNSGFGTSSTELFGPAAVGLPALDIGESLTVTIAVTVQLTDPLHVNGMVFTNTAFASGASPGGLPAVPTDWEPGPVVPERIPSNDAVVSFPEDPVISIDKELVAIESIVNADGTYFVTYDITVRNDGDVNLYDIQVTDELPLYGRSTPQEAFSGVIASLLPVEPAAATLSLTLSATPYDGIDNTDLLLATGSALAPGSSQVIRITFTAEPAESDVPYTNTAGVTATSPVGNPVTDEDGASVTHPFEEEPSIGIATCVASSEAQDTVGEWLSTFTVVVGNYGNVQLNELSVALDLATIFMDAAHYELVSVQLEGAGINEDLASAPQHLNAAFLTGSTELLDNDALLLLTDGQADGDGSDVLTFTVAVRVIPGSNLSYDFTATADGVAPLGSETSDVSVTDCAPHPGEPGDPTKITYDKDAEIAVAKHFIADSLVSLGDGVFEVTFVFNLQNTGNVPLTNVSLIDGFSNAFYDGSTYEIIGVTASEPLFPIPDTDYAGAVSSGELLDSSSQLGTAAQAELDPTAAGYLADKGTVTVTLRVTPVDPSETYLNSALAGGTPDTGESEEPVEDPSNDGEDPTPGVDDPTPFTFETPIIGLAKDAPTTFDFGNGVEPNPRNHADGTYEVGYTLTIRNYGDVPLSNITVTDPLLTQLADGNPVSARAVSGSFTANPAWDGSDATTNILEDGQTLAYNEDEQITETVQLIVTLEPGAALESGALQLTNQAHAAGTSPGGNTVEDDSNAGTDPDRGQPDDGDTSNDGDGDPTNNDGPTTVTLTESPRVAIAKNLDELENLGTGTYRATFTLNVANQGDVNLSSVQVVDDLNATFRNTPVTIQELTATAPFTAGSSTTAAASGELLDASSSTLGVGESAAIRLIVDFTPGEEIQNGAFENSALATGDSPAGREVTDTSNDGTEPDPGDDTPTPIVIIEEPSIGVAKNATVTALGDGRYDVRFDFNIRNYGNIELRNLQLVEDLDDAFGAGTTEILSLHSPTLSTNSVAPDASVPDAFDGSAHQNLLLGTDTLARGASATISLLVRVTPERMGTHHNQVRVTSSTPGGEPVEDDSTDGTDPDPDGDGDPGNNNEPTPIPFSEDPLIGLAKHAAVTPRLDGTFDVLLTFTVRNLGDVPLTSVRITDPLDNIYGLTDLSPDRVTVQSSTLTANPAFDGRTDTEILAGTDTLAVGEQRTVSIKLGKLTPTSGSSTTNTAVATGTSPQGEETTDRSNDGFEPDRDDDTPTPIILEVKPEIALAKSAAAVMSDDGLFTVTFTLRVKNTGNTPLLGVQVQDDLAEYYANTSVNAGSITVTSDTLSVNSGFDGQSDPDLLDGTDTLAVGAQADITLILTGLSVTGESTVANTALASGSSPDGERVEDRSNDGFDPEPGQDPPTITELVPNPLLGVAKRASVSNEADGSFSVQFDFVLRNYGNTDLVNLSLVDDLSEFYADASLISSGVSTSSDTLPLNAAFDGQSDTELLGSGATLLIGESKTLTITLSGLQVSGRTSFMNQASGEGESPGGQRTPPEKSTDGDDPDPDGDGDPTNNDEPTPVELVPNPILGVAKKAGVTQKEDGSYRIELTFTLSNMGNTVLNNLELLDDISSIYAGTTLVPGGISVSSTDLPVNPGYDGRVSTNLLGSGASLTLGQTAHVTLVLDNVTPTTQTRFLNSALGKGEAPDGTPTEDTSTNGDDPDPDGDGDPTNNDEPTPIVLEPEPRIGIAKKATLAAQDDGSYHLTFDFVVGNYGNTELRNIQVRDSLRNLYELTNLKADMITLNSADFSVNPAYDGDANQDLLTGSDSLALGGRGSVQLRITGLRVTQSVHTTNTAIATGEDPNGNPSPPDPSTDGDDPDPDGDGDPGNNNEPTPIDIPGESLIGLAKRASVSKLDNGVYDLAFTLRVVNYGDVPLTNLSITDSLAEFYDNTSLSVSSVSVTSATLSVNAAYDGLADTELLTGTDTLTIGGSAELTITLSGVTPNPGVTRLENQAFTTGTTPTGGTVTDTSTDGNDPDPDGDGDPGNNSKPTPVVFDDHTGITIDKRAAPGPYSVGDRVPYTITIRNPNDVPVTLTVTDTLPEQAAYISGTTAFEPTSITPSGGAEPRGAGTNVLTWRSLVIPAGQEFTISYSLRVLPGASGTLVNTALVDGRTIDGSEVHGETSEQIRIEAGVFDLERGLLIGRVYLDVNGDNTYTHGIDVPLKDARVVLGNGWQARTDEEGNYAFRDLETGTWTVQVDQVTAPYAPNTHPEQLRDPRLHKVHVQGVTVSDFPFETLSGLTGARRETTVTFGPITLHKYLLVIPDGLRVVMEVTSDEPQPAILITDPVGDGHREFTVTPGAEREIITYDLPRGAQLTDPGINWSFE